MENVIYSEANMNENGPGIYLSVSPTVMFQCRSSFETFYSFTDPRKVNKQGKFEKHPWVLQRGEYSRGEGFSVNHQLLFDDVLSPQS